MSLSTSISYPIFCPSVYLPSVLLLPVAWSDCRAVGWSEGRAVGRNHRQSPRPVEWRLLILPEHASFSEVGFQNRGRLHRNKSWSYRVTRVSQCVCVYLYLVISLLIYFFYISLFIHFYSHSTASQVSWNITVYSITSSSASVRWLNFPLSANVIHYLVRYKEPSGVSVLFRASSYSNTHYTNRLKGYTSYDIQVFASTTGINGNITYSSQTVSIETPEGGKLSASTTPTGFTFEVSFRGQSKFLLYFVS